MKISLVLFAVISALLINASVYSQRTPTYPYICRFFCDVAPRQSASRMPEPFPDILERDQTGRRSCPYLPLNLGKIQESDLKYLSEIFTNFDENNFQVAKNIWKLSASSCSNLTEAQLFSNLVKVFKKFDITSALDRANIKPSNTKLYTVKQVKDVLSSLFEGIVPIIYCSKAEIDAQGKQVKPQAFQSTNISFDDSFKPFESMTKDAKLEVCRDGFIYPKQK